MKKLIAISIILILIITFVFAQSRIWKAVKTGILDKREIDKLAEERYWRERTSKPMTAAEAAAYEAIPLKERPFYKKVRDEIERRKAVKVSDNL